MCDNRMPGPGDLGRRIAARRQQLGWSRAQLAAKAGLSVSYLTHVETYPALVTRTCLIQLADALGTTAEGLLGAGSADQPAAATTPALAGPWVPDARTGRPGERPGPSLG
jgi:transcriptional regulator with XRE-family HTH domain